MTAIYWRGHFSEGVIKRLVVFVLNELATAVLKGLFHSCSWYFVIHIYVLCACASKFNDMAP